MAKNIIKLLNRDNPPLENRLKLLEELYWANWAELDANFPGDVDKIFNYLRSNDLGIQEMAKVLPLYNNIEGAYTKKFAQIIADYYSQDKMKFIKALNLNKEEAINLVYIFRNLKVFEDEKKEYSEIESKEVLTEEELETARTFFSMYKNICNT